MIKNESFKQWDLGQLVCVKIGSTFHPRSRKSAYTPYAPTPWEYMALIKIHSARERNAYDIDDHLKKMSSLRRLTNHLNEFLKIDFPFIRLVIDLF